MMLFALSFVLCGGVAALRGPTQHVDRSRVLLAGAGDQCATSDECQADLFCNGDPKCEACYYPGDLSKDEAACDRYVSACCPHGLSASAALCECAAEPEPTAAPNAAATPLAGEGDQCATSDECQTDLFCNGDPKCEACYYPGDLSKDEAACDRYVSACCPDGLSASAALCECATTDESSTTPTPTSAPTPAPIATTDEPSTTPTPKPIATTGKPTIADGCGSPIIGESPQQGHATESLAGAFVGNPTICSNHNSDSATFVAVNDAGDLFTWSVPTSLRAISWIARGVDKAFCSRGSFAVIGTDTSVGSWPTSDTWHGGDSSSVAEELRSGIVDIFMNEYAFAALTDEGGLVTWGVRAGSGGDSSSVVAQLKSGVVSVSSSRMAFAALKDNGQVVAWGDASEGGVVPSGVAPHLTSGVVKIFSNIVAFAALKNDGSLHTWGSSWGGGDSSAVASELLEGVVDVFTSGSTVWAALKSSGKLVVWGDTSTYAAGPLTASGVLAKLESGVVKVFSTYTAFAVVKDDGEVVTWGFGQSADSTSVAEKLKSGVVVTISSTDYAFAALMQDGSVVTWGVSDRGGDSTAVAADLTSGVVSLYATGWAFAALKENGQVVAWGNPLWGGNPQIVKSALASNIKSVHTNEKAFVAITNGGSVLMWGSSNHEQVDGYAYMGTDFDWSIFFTGGADAPAELQWSSLATPRVQQNDGSGSGSRDNRMGSTSIIIIVCVVGVVVFAAVAFLIRKRFVATHQHHRASMPSLEKETQESA